MTSPNGLRDASRVALWTRSLKIAALQAQRLAGWVTRPEEFGEPQRLPVALPHTRYATRISLSRTSPDAHPVFEAGKKHNVALAAPAFDGLLIEPHRPFSFWRTLGRVTEARGFRHGMELSAGCIVPALGGGLCLLSRALFQAAVFSGARILERHGHSMQAVEIPPGVPWGIDATLLYPYVDLRFAPTEGRLRLSVRVHDDALLVSVSADDPLPGKIEVEAVDDRVMDEEEGPVRYNRVLRHSFDDDGNRVTDIVAWNRSKVLRAVEQRRNCLTCNEAACHARVRVPA